MRDYQRSIGSQALIIRGLRNELMILRLIIRCDTSASFLVAVLTNSTSPTGIRNAVPVTIWSRKSNATEYPEAISLAKMRSYRPYSRWGGGVGKRYQSKRTRPPTFRNASVHIRNLPAFANEGNVLDWCKRTVCGDRGPGCSDRIVRNIWMGKPVMVRDTSKEEADQVTKRLRYAHVNFADPVYAKVMLAHADSKEYDGSSEPTVRMPCENKDLSPSRKLTLSRFTSGNRRRSDRSNATHDTLTHTRTPNVTPLPTKNPPL